MLKVIVRGYRGIERAEFRIDPLALLGGQNYAGKSSICQAVAAALTGCTIPYFRPGKPDRPALTKTAAKALVRGGMDKASVVVTADTGRVSIEWPSHEIKSEGSTPPYSSKIAAGLLNPLDLDDAERQKLLSELLQAEPSDEDVLTACRDAQLSEDVASGMCKALGVQGWDPLYRAEKERGARLKGQWEAVAGTDFGVRKAEGWLPAGWNPDLNETTPEKLEESVANARQRVENALGALAVNVAEVDRLGQAAIAERQAESDVKAFEPQYRAALDQHARALAALDAIHVPRLTACPHCKGLLAVHDDEVRKSDLTEAELDELSAKKARASAASQLSRTGRDDAEQRMRELKAKLQPLEGSSQKYETARAKTGNQQALDEARDVLRSLEGMAAALKAKQGADRVFAQIAQQLKIIDILAPDGLRRQKLTRALRGFNARLAVMCEAADFPVMQLDDSLDLLYGARPYFLLSESEKYRCRAVLQTAIAEIDDSLLVILDGADILDAEGRNGLFALIGENQALYFLVAMTVNKPEHIPNLAKLGLGDSYWVSEGNLLSTVEQAPA